MPFGLACESTIGIINQNNEETMNENENGFKHSNNTPKFQNCSIDDHNYSTASLSIEENEVNIDTKVENKQNKKVGPQAISSQILDPEESQYKQYTIYFLHDKRINELSTNKYQMLKINDKPLDNHIKTLDLQCFPDLYPYGKNGQREKRKVRLTDYEYIKSRLESADPRFRLNQQ